MHKLKPWRKAKPRSRSIDSTSQSAPQSKIQPWVRHIAPEATDSSTDNLRPTFSTQSNTLEYDGGISVEKSQSELTVLKKDNDLKQAKLVIVVMGPTGAGKSRFIKEATGENVPVGDSLKSCQLTDDPD